MISIPSCIYVPKNASQASLADVIGLYSHSIRNEPSHRLPFHNHLSHRPAHGSSDHDVNTFRCVKSDRLLDFLPCTIPPERRTQRWPLKMPAKMCQLWAISPTSSRARRSAAIAPRRPWPMPCVHFLLIYDPSCRSRRKSCPIACSE